MGNWLSRSTATGVTLATNFGTDAEVLPYRHAAGMNPSILARVTRSEDEGQPCLKIATPGDSKDEQSQGWWRRMNPAWTQDADGFGTTPWWFQVRVKIPGSRLIPYAPGKGTWKFVILANRSLTNPNGAPNQSSNSLSHVLTNKCWTDSGTIPPAWQGKHFPILYKHDDVYSNGRPFEEAIPRTGDINLSPGWDQGPKPDYRDRYCCYTDPRGGPLWPTEEWVTFMTRIHTRTFGGMEGNELDVWWARRGATQWTTLLSRRNYLVGSLHEWKGGFNGVLLTPFETGKDKATGVDTYVLYRELIVSTQDITIPTDEPEPIPEPTPMDELDITVSNVPWELYEDPEANPGLIMENRIFSARPKPQETDCVQGPWDDPPWVEGALTPEVCPASGVQTRTDTRILTRETTTPPSPGGVQCGPSTMLETRTVQVPCTYVPPPSGQPTYDANGRWTPTKDGNGVIHDFEWNHPLNQLIEWQGSRFDQQLTTPFGTTAPYTPAGTGPVPAIFNNYTGQAFDEATGDGHFEGGGHAGGSINGVFRFETRKGLWSVRKPPTHNSKYPPGYAASGNLSKPLYPSGVRYEYFPLAEIPAGDDSKCAAHEYSGHVFVGGAVNELVFARFGWYHLELNSNNWRVGPQVPVANRLGFTDRDMIAVQAHYIASTGLIYMLGISSNSGYWTGVKYNPATRQEVGTFSVPEQNYMSTACMKGDELWYFYGSETSNVFKVWAKNLVTGATVVPITNCTGRLPRADDCANPVQWIPSLGKFLMWACRGGWSGTGNAAWGDVLEFDPATKVFSLFPTTGPKPPIPNASRMANKMRFWPRYGVLIWHTETNKNAWVMRVAEPQP